MNLNKHTSEKSISEGMSLMELIGRIKEWYEYLLSQIVIIIFFVIFGGIVGFSYAYLKKPLYTATTTFVLENGEGGSGGGLGQYAGLASIVGVDLGGGNNGIFQGDNILELYKSRTMIQKALLSKASFDNKEQILIDRFIEFNKLKSRWRKTDWAHANFSDTKKFTVLQDSILGVVVKDINKNYLSVSKPDKKSSVIKVEVKSHDELFSKSFSEAIVSSVNRFYIETKTKRSVDNIIILQQKTDSVRSVMNGAINVAAAVVDATPNLNPTRQAQRSAPIQRSQFSAETNKTVLQELVKNLELSKISLRKETPLIQIIDQPIVPLDVISPGRIVMATFFAVFFGILCIIFLGIKKMILDII